MKLKDNIFYNHIPYERIDMIDKLAYLYWYKNVDKDHWTQDDHRALYEKTKREVMEYGYGYYLDQKESK